MINKFFEAFKEPKNPTFAYSNQGTEDAIEEKVKYDLGIGKTSEQIVNDFLSGDSLDINIDEAVKHMMNLSNEEVKTKEIN